MDYLVTITFAEGQSQVVLVRASSAAAAEQAAVRRWRPGAGSSILARSVADSGVGGELLAQYRNNPDTYLDAMANSAPGQPGPEDPGSQNPPGQQPQNPGQGQMPQSPQGPGAQPPGQYLPDDSRLGEYGQFLRGLGRRGATTQGLLGSFNQNQSGAAKSLYNARLASGAFPKEDPEGRQYEDFVANTPNIYGSSLEALRNIRRVDPNDVASPADIYFRPGSEQDFSDAEGLFRAAMQGAYGGAASRFLSRFIDPAEKQFGAARIDGAGGSGQDYLEFLRKKLGLRGLFGNSVNQGAQAQPNQRQF
jgi:hypothetical protein